MIGSNFTTSAKVRLVGQAEYTLTLYSYTNPQQMSALLPPEIRTEDEQRWLSLYVVQGESTSATLPSALWMMNALTVTGVRGCAANLTANTAAFCVPGNWVSVTGTGFTRSSLLLVGGVPSDICSSVTPTSMSCRLPPLQSPIPAAPQTVAVRSGTATSVAMENALTFIPTPQVAAVSAVSGCTSRTGRPPADCIANAVLMITGGSFLTATTVELWGAVPGARPVFCAPLTYVSAYTLRCTLPSLAPPLAGSWLTVLVNNSLPTVAGPTTVLEKAFSYAMPAPVSGPSDTRFGMTIDELVLVIVVVVLVVALLLMLQAVWCLTRFGGVRFARLERACPRLMAAMKGARRGEDEGRPGIHLGLLQHDAMRFDPLQPQPSEGRRTPYTPFASQFASASASTPSSVSAPPPPPTFAPAFAFPPAHYGGYQAYHVPPPPSAYPPHLVPPSAEGAYSSSMYAPPQYAFTHYHPPAARPPN